MGFALWMEDELAWAQGTHEYKPMGTAVVAASDVFRPRDFRRARRAPRRTAQSFIGLFASLEDVNRHLRRRRSQAISRFPSQRKLRLLSVV
jgi:hypothetical protein